jgi:hypothetical protein
MNNSDDLVNSATYRTYEITVHRSSGEERAGEQYEMTEGSTSRELRGSRKQNAKTFQLDSPTEMSWHYVKSATVGGKELRHFSWTV